MGIPQERQAQPAPPAQLPQQAFRQAFTAMCGHPRECPSPERWSSSTMPAAAKSVNRRRMPRVTSARTFRRLQPPLRSTQAVGRSFRTETHTLADIFSPNSLITTRSTSPTTRVVWRHHPVSARGKRCHSPRVWCSSKGGSVHRRHPPVAFDGILSLFFSVICQIRMSKAHPNRLGIFTTNALTGIIGAK